MPGILYHLSFAEEVYRNLQSDVNFDKTLFMSGNLIPDLATEKSLAHYSIPASVPGFFIPNMEQAAKQLYDLSNPIYFGMYCHLYLDTKFIEEFIIPNFIWDIENMMVTNPRNNLKWDMKTFFSQKGMYGSYSEINALLIRDKHISMETISEIPEQLPITGICVFDNRKSTTWKEELNTYMSENKAYTGNVFDYDELWHYILATANDFIKEGFIL